MIPAINLWALWEYGILLSYLSFNPQHLEQCLAYIGHLINVRSRNEGLSLLNCSIPTWMTLSRCLIIHLFIFNHPVLQRSYWWRGCTSLLLFTRKLWAFHLKNTTKGHSTNVKRNNCVDEIITIYIIWVNTYSLVSLGISRREKISMETFQTNPIPPIKQEHCQWGQTPCLISF
jgi:hypothetical protein